MATDPGTRSPGHLFLSYISPAAIHTTSVRLVDGVDLDDITTLRADATGWTSVLRAVLPFTHTLTEWGLRSNQGTILYRETWATTVPGVHGTSGENWNSATLYIQGHGNSIGAGSAFGHMGFRIFTGGAYQPTAGTIGVPVGTDAELQATKVFLDGSTRIFADFYGQKGDVGAIAAFQFNAHAQRKLGS